MNTALIIVFLIISSLLAFPAFYTGGGRRTGGEKTASKILGVAYILTHLLVAGASLGELVDYETGTVLEGFYLVSSSYLTMILFIAFEVLALVYAVFYFVATSKKKSIKVFSAVTGGVSVFIGIAYSLVLWFFGGDYIDWTCLFFFIPYCLYGAIMFVLMKQNEPIPVPKIQVRQILPKEKLRNKRW